MGEYDGLFPSENINSLLQLESHLEKLTFDIFQLEELTKGKSLLWMGLTVFKKHDLFNALNLNKERFINFLTDIESLYQANPYHNSIHAADVTQTTHFLITTVGMGEGFSKLEIFSILLSALVHDVDHPGYSNQFLMKTQHPIAITHNDTSVLENHHCSVAFYTLSKPNNNFIESLSKNDKSSFRKNLIYLILGTDFSRNQAILEEFNDHIARGAPKVAEKDRQLTLLITLKCADLGHTIKGFKMHHKWSYRIMEENELQAEEEAKRGMEINQKMCLEDSQVNFITKLVQPLFSPVETVYPLFKVCVTQLLENLEYWRRVVRHNNE